MIRTNQIPNFILYQKRKKDFRNVENNTQQITTWKKKTTQELNDKNLLEDGVRAQRALLNVPMGRSRWSVHVLYCRFKILSSTAICNLWLTITVTTNNTSKLEDKETGRERSILWGETVRRDELNTRQNDFCVPSFFWQLAQITGSVPPLAQTLGLVPK